MLQLELVELAQVLTLAGLLPLQVFTAIVRMRCFAPGAYAAAGPLPRLAEARKVMAQVVVILHLP